MRRDKSTDDRYESLREYHALNPRPEAVTDKLFASDSPFFDARDLVQVKYEMLRQVHEDGQPVVRVAAAFGFSRPSFYQAQSDFANGGLPGLLPERRGPRRAHKLGDDVMAFIEAELSNNPALRSSQLAERVGDHFGMSVHARSIERALDRRQKKRQKQQP
jgi:transposase